MYMHETEGKQSFYLFSIQSTKKLKVLICTKKVNNKMWWVKKKGRVKTDERNIWGENLFYFTRENVKKV